MKNIVFFDLETTGKAKNTSKVRIIEISAVKINEEMEIIDKLYFRCNNDGVPIEKDAYERHGIAEEELVDLPTFTQVAPTVFKFFEGCDVGGHYCAYFDVPILYESFLKAGKTWNFREIKVYDTYLSYKKYNSGKLGDLYKKYTGKDLENAHSADADAIATVEVYRNQVKDNEKLEGDELLPYSNRLDMMGYFKFRTLPDGTREVYIDFGKYIGKAVKDIDPSYLTWVGDSEEIFPTDTRYYARVIASKLSK